MKLPDTDDLMLFGSLVVMALGSALVTGATTGNGILSIGVAFMVFAVPAFLVIFMAAGESE